MSDITSAKTAVQVGKIYNLDGILVGSMMKVGEKPLRCPTRNGIVGE